MADERRLKILLDLLAANAPVYPAGAPAGVTPGARLRAGPEGATPEDLAFGTEGPLSNEIGVSNELDRLYDAQARARRRGEHAKSRPGPIPLKGTR